MSLQLLEALLVDIQVAEARVQQIRVRPIAVFCHVLIERCDPSAYEKVMLITRRVSSRAHDRARLRSSIRMGFAAPMSLASSTPPNDGRLSSVNDCLNSDQPSCRDSARKSARPWPCLMTMRTLLASIYLLLRTTARRGGTDFVHLRAAGILLDNAVQRCQCLFGLAGRLVCGAS